MGRPKAWLPWAGQPILCHVVSRLAEVVDEVIVVAAPDQLLPEVGVRVVSDREGGLGPLAGIAEGLRHAAGELAFVTATDAPYLTAAFVRALLAVGGAAAPSVDGFVHPLSAVYPTSAADRADDLLREGRRRPLDLLEALAFERLSADRLPDVVSVRGFNTPAEYLEASRAEPGAPVTVELMGRARRQAGRRCIDVPVGALREVLGAVSDHVSLVEDGRVATPYRISLDGRAFVCDVEVPIGPGEHVIVLDASVGG